MGRDRLKNRDMFRSWLIGWVVLLLALLSSACLPASAGSPAEGALETASPSPTASSTPTPTIVWFPPTPTFTPFPTSGITPTVEVSIPHGEVILRDDFSTEESWPLVASPAGNIAIGNKRLNIAVNQPRALLSSLRTAPEIGDYYWEVTAHAGLCMGRDEYGLILRAASQADFLRYALSCDGYVRLDRITGGQATSPQPWTLSGAFRPGAPGEARLGVWASGKEIRFYINDELQFTWNEPGLLSGQIGLFARTAGDSPLSVSFSDLVLYQPNP